MPSVILATAGYDHTIRFWEAPSGICYRPIQYAESQINKLEITPDRNYLAAAGNPHVRFFEVNTNNPNPVISFDGHKSNVTAIGFQKEGKWMYTGSEDHTIKLWDISFFLIAIRAPGCQRNFECAGPVNTVVLHPNQSELISGDQNGNIRVWDLTSGSYSRELVPDGETAIRSISIAPDGSKIVAANNSGKCFIWKLGEKDTTQFDPLQKIEAHKTYILKCLFSPDMKYLATTSADHTVKLWNIKDFSLAKTLTGHQRWVWDCAFSGDSVYLVTGELFIRFFFVRIIHPMNADGATVSSDQTARLWDVAQGETARTYTGHSKAITCVCLHDVPEKKSTSS